MTNLQLTLVEGAAEQKGSTFDVSTKSVIVGRSKQCDWVLIDNDRFISNRHLQIAFTGDAFMLTDLSSNGVFINNSDVAVGKGQSCKLELNDVISLDKIQLLVSKLELANTAQKNDLFDLVSQPESPAAPVENSSDGDLGLFDILNSPASSSQSPTVPFHTQPKQASAPIQEAPQAMPQASELPSANANTIPDDWDLQLDNDDSIFGFAQTQQAPVVSNETTDFPPVSAPVQTAEMATNNSVQSHLTAAVQATTQQAPAGIQNSMQTNMQGDDFFNLIYDRLGLPAGNRDSIDKHVFADEIVKIIQASTQGIMALLAGRSVFKQESRLDMTMIKPRSNNPIKFSLDYSDVLEMLLVKKKPGYMSAQEAYSEALNDIQTHQMAFLNGYQASLSEILSTLDPEQIEDEASQQSKSLIGMRSSQQKWNVYSEKQASLKKQVAENLNDVLSTYFSPAYEKHIKEVGKTNEQY